jgi:histo-blood group ABO system transferase
MKLYIGLVASLCFSFFLSANNIGLCIVATGKYIQFVEPLVISADIYFVPGHTKTYFVFTDQEFSDSLKNRTDVVRIEQKKLGWPYDTMMRFAMYLNHADILKTQDYLFACDADMLFVSVVGDEVLGSLVATQHPGFVGKRGTYETDPRSTAAISAYEGTMYFAGGFYGGKSDEVLKLCKTNVEHIKQDLKNSIIAVWHDESHLNRYFVDHKPTVILSPAYCYPEQWKLPYSKKLLALDKNHAEMRS